MVCCAKSVQGFSGPLSEKKGCACVEMGRPLTFEPAQLAGNLILKNVALRYGSEMENCVGSSDC